MSGMHFEHMAAEYATSRPPYPPELYDLLRADGVIGPGRRVLEIGAGSGLATPEIVRSGSDVVAIEPGRDLATLLARDVENVSVIVSTLEDAALPGGFFDSVLAATSMHWVELASGLPKLHATLRPGGWLAVWQHRFTDDTVATTTFRRRVQEIANARSDQRSPRPRPNRATIEELAAGGWFEPVRSERWQWSLVLDTDKVRRLFRTFPDWADTEVESVSQAVVDLGGLVTEHYQTVLHLLRRVEGR